MGSLRISLDLSITSINLALADLARCDLPKVSKSNFAVSHPGLFLHGPEEKYALEGFVYQQDQNIVEIKNMVKYFGPEDKIKVQFEY